MRESILRALSMAFAMGWEILWPLILGFALCAVVQAVVSHREMARLLPDDRPELCRTLVARDLLLDRRKTIAELRRRGALVVEAPPGEVGMAAVNGYLEIKRRQLL